MPKSNGSESQALTIDSLTIKKLALLVEQSLYNLQSSRTSEIFLASLESYLGESSNIEEGSKSSLLLDAYLNVVPKLLEESEDLLIQANEQLSFILAASNLGAANTQGSHDDD